MADLQAAIGLARNRSSGTSAALGELLESCRQYLLLIANRELEPELRAKTGASDVVQETLLAAGCNFERFGGSTEGELLAWVRQILLFQLASIRRRYCQTEKRRVDRERSLDDDRYIPMHGQLVDFDSPSKVALQHEQLDILQSALNRVPEKYRTVIQLRHRDHQSFSQVAEELEISSDAARQLWARSIRRLQREIRIACGQSTH